MNPQQMHFTDDLMNGMDLFFVAQGLFRHKLSTLDIRKQLAPGIEEAPYHSSDV